MQRNEFVVYCGPMTGGKTSALLAYVDRCHYQKKTVIAFKPAIDNRYDKQCITSHSGWKIEATIVSSVSDIYETISNLEQVPDVVALDEAFMLDGAADTMIWLFRQGITVVVSTLDLSFNCKPFKEVEKMLPWATSVVKCPSVCVVCGNDAYYTHKKVLNENEIEVGGLELYEPRCWFHHPLIKNDV